MNDGRLTPLLTEDGSYTFFSEEFRETFHSSFGAKQEAQVRYVEPCQIKQLAAQKSIIRILDVCYGLGYNSAATLQAIWSVNPECSIELFALEIAAEIPLQAVEHNLLTQWRSPVPKLLAQLSNEFLVEDKFFQGRLLLGDARSTVKAIVELDWQADAIFLDPFSPPKCPQLWTVEFINLVAQCLAPSGRLATYSCSAAVRTALLTAGLNIGSIWGAGRKSPGTLATHKDNNIHSLSIREQEHLATRASIPYRDPSLKDSSQTIIYRRQQEQQNCVLEPTSRWSKRWIKANI